MRNVTLFKGAQITFAEGLLSNAAYNQTFNRDGFRQHMLPETESTVSYVERELLPWLNSYNAKFEREFTNRAEGTVTMYIATTQSNLSSPIRAKLAAMQTITTSLGSMHSDASWHPSKNQ